MTRTVAIAGFAAIAASVVALQLAALATRRLPTAGAVVRLLVRGPVGRGIVLAGWLWLGWHLFVRASRG